MEIKGKIHAIGALEQVSETFKKRDLVLEYAENPTYPEFIKFEALQDKTDLFNSLSVGQEVEISFNLRGRPWTDKTCKTSYFNSLVVWRVVAVGSAPGKTPQYAPPAPLVEEDPNDMPF